MEISGNYQSAFVASCLGIFFFGIGITTPGSVLPELRMKFALDAQEAGTLFSILPGGIILGSLFFGPICDRFGYNILLATSCLFMCLGFEGIAFGDSVTILRIAVFLFGIGGGAVNGATSAAVSDLSGNSKAGNLSLLGLFFGLGAWGMPFLLASLKGYYSYETIIAAFGVLCLVPGFLFLVVKFPPAKQSAGFALGDSLSLFRQHLLLLVAFFLFCQSSFEAIINNWTTSFLISYHGFDSALALYGLSTYVGGYTLMRLLLGTVFRDISTRTIIIFSLLLMITGTLMLSIGIHKALMLTGLALLGAGLSGGFPIMLSIVGSRYASLSGTAFSFVLVIALTGNILVNYAMGIVAEVAGIKHLLSFSLVECLVMTVLAYLIMKKTK